MSNLRAGLIGLGMMGRHRAHNLRAIDGVDLVVVADAQGDPHGVAEGLPVLPDVNALPEQNLDYVVIAAPTMYHEEIGLKVAEAGMHALIEKPLTKTFEDAQHLVRASASKGFVGAVGRIERYNPALQELRKRLKTGELGDLYQVCTRRQGPFPTRIVDVGVIRDLASRDIDLTAWVAQHDYELIAVRTMLKAEREYEDMVSVTCQLSGGLISNHLVNWLTPTKERLTIVTGEKGMFIADILTADPTFYANSRIVTTWDDIVQFRGVSEGDVTRLAIAKPEPLRTEHEGFRDAILDRDSNVVTLGQGTQVVRVCEAMIESAATNQFVGVR